MAKILEVLLIFVAILTTCGFIVLRFSESFSPKRQSQLDSSAAWNLIFLLPLLIVGLKLLWTHLGEVP